MSVDYSADELDAAYAAVWERHPDLSGAELVRKVRLLAALRRYSHNGPTWSGGDSR